MQDFATIHSMISSCPVKFEWSGLAFQVYWRVTINYFSAKIIACLFLTIKLLQETSPIYTGGIYKYIMYVYHGFLFKQSNCADDTHLGAPIEGSKKTSPMPSWTLQGHLVRFSGHRCHHRRFGNNRFYGWKRIFD